MASLRSAAAFVLLGATVAALAATLGAQILPARQYKAGIGVTSMATGDLNLDGLADVVCGSYNASVISVMLQDEAGGFLAATTLAVDGSAPEVDLGDLNGDDLLDVVSSDSVADSLSVRLGDGDGGFGPLSVFHIAGPRNRPGDTSRTSS